MRIVKTLLRFSWNYEKDLVLAQTYFSGWLRAKGYHSIKTRRDLRWIHQQQVYTYCLDRAGGVGETGLCPPLLWSSLGHCISSSSLRSFEIKVKLKHDMSSTRGGGSYCKSHIYYRQEIRQTTKYKTSWDLTEVEVTGIEDTTCPEGEWGTRIVTDS